MFRRLIRGLVLFILVFLVGAMVSFALTSFVKSTGLSGADSSGAWAYPPVSNSGSPAGSVSRRWMPSFTTAAIRAMSSAVAASFFAPRSPMT